MKLTDHYSFYRGLYVVVCMTRKIKKWIPKKKKLSHAFIHPSNRLLLNTAPPLSEAPDPRTNEENRDSNKRQYSADNYLDNHRLIITKGLNSRQGSIAQAKRNETPSSTDNNQERRSALREAIHGVGDTNDVRAQEGEETSVVADDDGGRAPFLWASRGLAVQDAADDADDGGDGDDGETVLGLVEAGVAAAEEFDHEVAPVTQEWQEDEAAGDLSGLDVAQSLEGE